ncbi:hypothetical protein [Vibrio ishigakensis]|nr:hypothetical protein [Vibrio ishigakensis]
MKLSNRTQGQLEDWIKGLFRAFDRLEKDCFFMPFLDDDVYLSIHGQEYYGHEGFKQWMGENRAFFSHGSLLHHSHSFSFDALENGLIQVSFLLEFKAESKEGERFEHQVSEQWLVRNISGQFRILSYQVTPLS